MRLILSGKQVVRSRASRRFYTFILSFTGIVDIHFYVCTFILSFTGILDIYLYVRTFILSFSGIMMCLDRDWDKIAPYSIENIDSGVTQENLAFSLSMATVGRQWV